VVQGETLKPIVSRVETACFQRLKIKYDKPLLILAFNFNLRRYAMGVTQMPELSIAVEAIGQQCNAHAPASLNDIVSAPKNLSRDAHLMYFKGGKGIEIGGPTRTEWAQRWYGVVKSIDNVDFSADTLWGKRGPEHIINGEVKGVTFIREGVNLHGIPDSTYDFV
jgi:hypothetical protein